MNGIIYQIVFFGLVIYSIKLLQQTNAYKRGNSDSKPMATRWQIVLISAIVLLSLFGETTNLFAAIFILTVGIITWLKKPKDTNNLMDSDIDPMTLEGTVKIQLHCFSSYKAKYPNEQPTQTYVRVMSQRPGYDEGTIRSVINQARSGSAHGKYNFQSVVTSMLMQEHLEDNNGDMPNEVVREIVDTVERIIPSNI